MRSTWLGTLVTMMFVGCANVPSAAEAPTLEGTSWVLVSLVGQASIVSQPATIRFEGGTVQGSDGCNRYSTPYSARGDSIEVGARGVSTQMACAPDVMKRASAFTSTLSTSRSYRVRDGRLELLGGDGAVLATFAAQSQALAGTTWRATGINNGRGGVASPVSGSVVTMRFEADGRLGGSAGCNGFNASYLATGPNLRITSPATTRKSCEASLMEQERAFLKALESVTTMRFEADRLELRTAAGALAVTLLREPGP